MVYVACSAEHFERHAVRLRQLCQGIHVGLGEYATHTGSRLQAAGSNFLIQTEGESQRAQDGGANNGTIGTGHSLLLEPE